MDNLKVKEGYKLLKIKIAIGSEHYDYVNTQILVPVDSEYYYIPTDYKNPMRVYLVDYNSYQSVDNIIMIMAIVSDEETKKQFPVSPKLLFKNSSKAGDYYLNHKNELNFKFLNIDKGDE